ncbi:hypothetical protein [Ralstonia pseudosolanacearum]|uniref:hypothetical protein n=1 Tax=Ralstonia pseudosolanacearum TaxID=1310165 RepID=UPI0013151212|nr:hypothetical protein [Ralstonia pseudosolanacearum]
MDISDEVVSLDDAERQRRGNGFCPGYNKEILTEAQDWRLLKSISHAKVFVRERLIYSARQSSLSGL